MEDVQDPRGGDRPGRETALSWLRPLWSSAEYQRIAGAEEPELGDAVLDHLDRILPGRRLEVLCHAVNTWFHDMARSVLLAEHLLVDPSAVVGALLADVLMETIFDRRIRPLRKWAPGRVGRAVEAVRLDDDSSLYPFEPGQSAPDRERAVWAQIINRLDSATRRLVWWAWGEWRTPAELERLTGWPYERIEAILQQTLERAAQHWGGQGLTPPGAPGSPEFWREMRREVGDDWR